MGLDEYIKKRKFDETPEPRGQLSKTDQHRFVIQRHRASNLHYDLRLEMNGVLKSWAIPKGPSMNPEDKRLAIMTEDHPVGYLQFEGQIPKGNYGAGHMHIWDSGTFVFNNAKSGQSYSDLLEEGDLKINFDGEKVKGNFALVKTDRGDKQQQWLLIKKKDDFSTDLEYNAENFSDRSSSSNDLKNLKPGTFVKPMLASSVEKIFDSADWIYELKWDGYRIISHIKNGKVELYSRNGISYTKKFNSIAKELEQIPHDAILDGEVVILMKDGLPDFESLQNYDSTTSAQRLYFYVFDILHLNGLDTISLPLIERKSLLPSVLEDLPNVKYCDHIEGMGSAFYNSAVEKGMEGVIAKKKASTYDVGRRSENWLKIKAVQSCEAFICGYTSSDKGGMLFGSLILGSYENEQLKYIGNCGSGFSAEIQKDLLTRFKNLESTSNPFEKKIDLKGRQPNWIIPKLICEVKYAEKTKSGRLRHPIYKGLRNDKSKDDVQVTKKSVKAADLTSNKEAVLDVNGLQVPISNLEKIYWPAEGYNKYDLISYYLAISELMLPYLTDRPQNLHRHPNGIAKESFYQKDHEILPAWIETFPIYSEASDKEIDYMLCQNEATLLYMANLGCIEINPWNSTIHNLDKPTYTVIDIDPSEKNNFEEVIEVAQAVKQVLDRAKITGYCKTSGSSGIHIYIPLEGKYTYDEARDFTKLLCYYVLEITEGLTSMERAVKSRKGKIYLDYLQNRRGQTLASAYCVRPKTGATVSAPIQWKELKSGLSIQDFTIKTMPERISKLGDIFTSVLGEGIDMEEAITALDNEK